MTIDNSLFVQDSHSLRSLFAIVLGEIKIDNAFKAMIEPGAFF